jgi:hypothetical protein
MVSFVNADNVTMNYIFTPVFTALIGITRRVTQYDGS